MTVLSLTPDLHGEWSTIDDLVAANHRLAYAHESAVELAVQAVGFAIEDEDAASIQAVTSTAMLVPELSGRIDEAIGEHLSIVWGFDVTVDSYTAAELDLLVPGPFTGDQENLLVRFLDHLKWWPSRVSVMFDDVMAVDASVANDLDRARGVVKALIASSDEVR